VGYKIEEIVLPKEIQNISATKIRNTVYKSMIIIDPIKDEENFTYSTIVTYPKTTQISHGVYDNVQLI
jgi:hypothetical protein